MVYCTIYKTHLFCGNCTVLIAALLFAGGLLLQKGASRVRKEVTSPTLAVCNEVYGNTWSNLVYCNHVPIMEGVSVSKVKFPSST